MELNEVKGIGPKTINILSKIGINNTYDLLTYYPYRYKIFNITNIDEVTNEEIVVRGIVNSIPKVSYIKRNFNRLSFTAIINNKLIKVVIFNRAFLKNNLTLNKEINLIGKYNKLTNTFTAANITFDMFDGYKIEPVYHLVDGLKNKIIINTINYLLDKNIPIDDYIPAYLNTEYKFIDKNKALKYLHNPSNLDEVKKAKLKLIYEELFIFMFKINYLKHKNLISSKVIIKKIDEIKINNLINNLPFQLTNDQLKAIDDLKNDFKSEKRMNRLLLGDVGSGKTVVAIIASYINYLNGFETSLMAPTEILATQHYYSIKKTLKDTPMVIELLTGSMTKKEQNNIKERLAKGEIDLLIGTHAIISKDVKFKKLGLVITDEQHRFGVNQRYNLQDKGELPDIIYMSATPIPRTYALTLYGDMDISIIKEKPKGRKDILTYVKKSSEIKDVLNMMIDEIKANHQIYVVAPLIEESETLDLSDINKLKDKFDIAFNHKIPIGILHGRLKNNEKEAIMNNFKNNIIKVLISTTVIEVGIDVPNANMMVIFNAERFGLATLHQLRGRVGRGDVESKCILISDSDTKRLKVLEESNDGFYISEMDFKMRGEGDLFGVRQSGDMTFKIANLKRDFKILLKTKEDSEEFINKENLNNYPLYQEITNNLESLN
ncbi:MAG TPA: ATP-dependent DNA helicase RecG [Bacilli bacterium]|nr:ATP-dependent DNA helicase RecG [Bacilli bacterium]